MPSVPSRMFIELMRTFDPLVRSNVTIMRKGETIGGYEYIDRNGKREPPLTSEVFHLRTVLAMIR